MDEDKDAVDRRKRAIVTFRTTEEVRRVLEAAAKLAGRSLTQELEARLEASFVKDEEVLGAANTALLKLIGASIRAQEVLSGLPWDTDEQTRAAMIEAVTKELETWTGPQAAWRRIAAQPRKIFIRFGRKSSDGSKI